MKILITGAAGMIGSHAAEYFATKDFNVIALDNLMRSKLFKSTHPSVEYNWNYLEKYKNITRIVGDVRNSADVEKSIGTGVDFVIHAAGQPGVAYSLQNPADDYSINAAGTFTLLETLRKKSPKVRVVYCSTNKVYGAKVDDIPLKEDKTRYRFDGPIQAISESFGIDMTGHTPYGASKYVGDLYMQEYAYTYGIPIGVFRMSCIYGTRQFGFEDQGWLAWFVIRAIKKQPVTIYGDGKQVRDALFVTDLVEAYHKFLDSDKPSTVMNMGGGPTQTLSLLELLDAIEAAGIPKPPVQYSDWRMFDQKVYISDIRKAQQVLNWQPKTNVKEGIGRLITWVKENSSLFQ